MALFKLPSGSDALEDLLERERRFLLAGELDKLARLSPEKVRLLEQLAGETADRQTLERLHAKADRNQALLAAVARGIRSVTLRLEAMKTNRTRLRTYDQGGASRDLMGQKSSFEKRA